MRHLQLPLLLVSLAAAQTILIRGGALIDTSVRQAGILIEHRVHTHVLSPPSAAPRKTGARVSRPISAPVSHPSPASAPIPRPASPSAAFSPKASGNEPLLEQLLEPAAINALKNRPMLAAPSAQRFAKYELLRRHVAAPHKAGIAIVVGTDAGIVGARHGSATLRELNLLAGAALGRAAAPSPKAASPASSSSTSVPAGTSTPSTKSPPSIKPPGPSDYKA